MSEGELRIGFRECFSGVRFDEGLLVGDELVEHIIGDLGLGCLDAIAHPRGRGDCHSGRFALSALKMGFAVALHFQICAPSTRRDISIRPLFFSSDRGMAIKVKARYEDAVLKLLEAVDLEEGEELEIEIPHSVADRTYSVSKLSDELIEEILETTERGE